MALVLKDRVKETSVTTGTGAITLLGATGAFQPFSIIGNGNKTYYCIAGQTTTEWEVGIGTYTLSTDTLSRDTILASSNSDTIVTFSAGTKDVFITYPSEKAIYEEPDGDTLINAGPITVLGPGVSNSPPPTPYAETLGRFYGNVDSFQQVYLQNQYNGTDASSDIVAYNNLGDGTNYFVDMGMASSTYSSASFPIFTANSAYLYNSGLTTGTGAAGETSELLIGTGTLNSDLVLFTGGVDTTNEAVRISGADQTIEVQKGVTLNETLDVTGAASFGSTVLLDADPTVALQAATKQYVDSAVTAGIHIHEPVRVETTGNLNATYTGGGTNANIIQIANGTDITFFSVTPSVGDQFYIGSSSNGLIANTAYFVVNIVSGSTVQASLTYGGAIVTGLTNGSPTIPSVINSGIGAYLTNAGTQVALTVDGIALSVADRVMVRLQTNGAHNGVYVVTTVGSGATNWVLTRATDASFVSPSDPDGLGTGDYFYTQEGTLNAGDSHVLTTEPNTMIIGYTTLTYTQFSGSVDYVGGTNINITGQTISLTGTVAATNGGTGTSTVTTGDLLYGSAANTWSKLAVGVAYQSLVVNGSGTQVEWNAVNLSSSNAVTGVLAATLGGTGQTTYALGDTLYSSAANTISKLSGNTSTTKQYLSQTGTGSASAAPSWASISASDIISGTLPAVRGGTGQSAYAVGDLLYADTTTTLAKLAATATGRVLISNGVSAAPSWSNTVSLTSLTSTTINGTTLSTTGNTILGDATTDTLNVAAGTLVTDGLGKVGIGTASPTGLIQLTGSTWRKGVLETTGVTAKAYQGSDSNGLNFTTNIYWNGSAWVQDDATKACFAYIQHLGNSRMEFRVAPSGAFTSWTTAMTLDTSANLAVTGTVSGTNITTGGNVTGSSTSCSGNAATATTATTANALNTANSYTGVNFTATGSFVVGSNGTYAAGSIYSDINWGMIFRAKQASPTGNAQFMWADSAGTELFRYNGSLTTSVTGSSGSCTGNAATATTATNQSGGTVTATTVTMNGTTAASAILGSIGSSWSGSTIYPTLYGSSADRWVMHINPHISYVQNGVNGFTGTTTGSMIRFASNTAAASYWDIGVGTSGVGADTYSIGRAGTNLVSINTSGSLTAVANVTAYSDERKKKNWRPVADNFVEKLAEVKSGVYDRTDQELTQVGVSAQAFQTLVPEAVLTDKDGFLSVAYGNAALVSAVELAKELVALKELVKELKAEVDELKKAR